MTNILLIGNDLKYFKLLTNKISKVSKEYRICCFAENNKEVILELTNNDIDIIILESNTKNFNEILGILKNNNKYSNCVIIVYTNNVNLDDNNYILIEKSDNCNNLIQKIETLLESPRYMSEIRNKIAHELYYLGYDIIYVGTRYLIDLIYFLYNNEEMVYNNNYEKNIYPIIGKKYGKSAHSIKCSIDDATSYMFRDADENVIQEYFNSKLKPSPRKVVLTILDRIIKESVN